MDEDFELDPEIAAAMGFASFGTQPSKKRKFDTNDGFVDPDAAPPSNGANSLPLGMRKDRTTTEQPQYMEQQPQPTVTEDSVAEPGPPELGLPAKPVEAMEAKQPTTEEEKLRALRFGLKNEAGDVTYFLPSFIEDPWKGLEPR